MSIFRQLFTACLTLAIPLVALAAAEVSNSSALQAKANSSPLIDKVRAATARFKDINVALHEGWTVATPCVSGPPPALEGNLMNLIGAPNRYDLPALWELHVWAWEDNPKGNFADWNTHVSCEQQTLE